MRYTATHSNDPYLLMRLYTDLKLCGVKTRDEWNNRFFPLSDESTCWHIIYCEPLGLQFHLHNGVHEPIRFEITEYNYAKVLTEILKP